MIVSEQSVVDQVGLQLALHLAMQRPAVNLSHLAQPNLLLQAFYGKICAKQADLPLEAQVKLKDVSMTLFLWLD